MPYELREDQWREVFGHTGGGWFCLVVERLNCELVGFAKGMLYDGDLPGFGGELNKIATNPSCGFWEALLGERLYSASGGFHGCYAWRDLRCLAALCRDE